MTKFSSNPEVRAKKPAWFSLKTPYLEIDSQKISKSAKKRAKICSFALNLIVGGILETSWPKSFIGELRFYVGAL